MYKFQLKVILHTRNQEVVKLMKKRQPLDAKTEMTEMSELSDEDFKVVITEVVQQTIANTLETKRLRASAKKQRLPNEEFSTEKYSKHNLKKNKTKLSNGLKSRM